jgi:hypothetical protein
VADLTSRRGILDPDAAERHFRLTRYLPAEDLAHLSGAPVASSRARVLCHPLADLEDHRVPPS